MMECSINNLCVCPNTTIKLPIPGSTAAPYVKVGFWDDAGSFITVGNRSSPPDNKAVIKSFEYGMSDGVQVKLEIIDEAGGNFVNFMERLNKTMSRVNNDSKMQIDFGWIYQTCVSPAVPAAGLVGIGAGGPLAGVAAAAVAKLAGNAGAITASSTAPGKLVFLLIKISSVYEGGKIKFTLEGVDAMDRIAENRTSKNYGTDIFPFPLKLAMRAMLQDQDYPPVVKSIQYLRRTNVKDLFSPWGFDRGPIDPVDKLCLGPMQKWQSDQQNKLATARKWLEGNLTDAGKGIVMTWNNSSTEPGVIFWEDVKPGCNQILNPCLVNLGTYIVNGGACSPVISFNPTANWMFAANSGSGGGTSGGGGGKTVAVKDVDRKCNTNIGGIVNIAGIEFTGIQQAVPDNQNNWSSLAPSKSVITNIKAQAAHMAACYSMETIQPIEAELQIQGDPSYGSIPQWFGSNVTIIYINPFNVQHQEGDQCGEWLASPVTNSVWTNNNWMIKGVNHQIKEGSYVTTLKVFLSVPNVDVNRDSRLGGPGSCGYKFKNAI